MRIHAPSADQLTFSIGRNWLFMALGVALMVVGLAIGLTMARITTFTADRTGPQAGLVRLQQATALKAGTSALLPVRWLDGASVAPWPTPVGWTFYRLVLAVDDGYGPYPLTWHVDRAEAQAHADRVNGFVADMEDERLLLTTDHRALVWAVAGAFAALGGLFLAAGAQTLEVDFRRATRTITLRRRGIWRRRSVTVPFEAVAGFEVGGVAKDCHLFLLRHGDRPLSMSLSTDWEAMGGPRRVRAIRRRTAERAEAFCRVEERPGEGTREVPPPAC